MSMLETTSNSPAIPGFLTQPAKSGSDTLRRQHLQALEDFRHQLLEATGVRFTIWGMDGYHAAGFRAIYRQAFHPKIWPMIEAIEPRIVHLVRRNVTRQGVSFGYQQLVRQRKIPYHPVHTFEERVPEPVEVDPVEIVGYAIKVRREMEAGAARLAAYPGRMLQVTYEDMVDNGPTRWMAPRVAYEIEDLLGVMREPLRVELRRDFPAPMADWFTNWRAIRRALKRAGFGGLDG